MKCSFFFSFACLVQNFACLVSEKSPKKGCCQTTVTSDGLIWQINIMKYTSHTTFDCRCANFQYCTESVVGNASLDCLISMLAVNQSRRRSLSLLEDTPGASQTLIVALRCNLAFRIGFSGRRADEAPSDARFAVQSKGYTYALVGHVSAE